MSAKLERRRDTMEELHKVSSLLKKLQVGAVLQLSPSGLLLRQT